MPMRSEIMRCRHRKTQWIGNLIEWCLKCGAIRGHLHHEYRWVYPEDERVKAIEKNLDARVAACVKALSKFSTKDIKSGKVIIMHRIVWDIIRDSSTKAIDGWKKQTTAGSKEKEVAEGLVELRDALSRISRGAQ